MSQKLQNARQAAGRPDLFVCHTAYQVFISCIRAMRAGQKPDIVLASGVLPGAGALAGRLAQSGLFGQVLTFNEQQSHSPIYKNPVLVLLFQHPMHRRHIEKYRHFRLDFARYGRVYFYNDWNELCRYAQDCHARYILCEDAFSGHTLPEHPWRTRQAARPFYRLRRALGYGYLYWGGYKRTEGIETEDPARTGAWAEHFIPDSKAALFASLTPEEKQRLTDIFVATPLPAAAEKPFLLLTRPYAADGLVPDTAAQLDIFRRVLDAYGGGCTVFIKPHPRDEADYAAAFPKAVILDKNMPSEVLNVAFPFRFARAVTVGSSALNTLSCADEKLLLPESDYISEEAQAEYCRRQSF